jgi:biopolymer transport protein ExbD
MAEITQHQTECKVRSKKQSTRIDITPMVDLAFLLLTFFILTTKLLQPYAMNLDVPEEDTTTTPPQVKIDRVLTLLLGENNKIYWFTADNKPQITDFSPVGLRKVLLENNTNIKNMVILIKPSKESVYRNVIDILDEMTITEMKHYYLVPFTDNDAQQIKKLLAKN